MDDRRIGELKVLDQQATTLIAENHAGALVYVRKRVTEEKSCVDELALSSQMRLNEWKGTERSLVRLGRIDKRKERACKNKMQTACVAFGTRNRWSLHILFSWAKRVFAAFYW